MTTESILNVIGINIAAIFFAQLILAVWVVRVEELSFWKIGMVFGTELISLLLFNKYRDKKALTFLINFYRGLSAILIINVVILFIVINTK